MVQAIANTTTPTTFNSKTTQIIIQSYNSTLEFNKYNVVGLSQDNRFWNLKKKKKFQAPIKKHVIKLL